MKHSLQKLPSLGVGIEWTETIQEELLENLDQISCIELIPENFFYGRHKSFLKELGKSQIPVLVHAVEMSIGTEEPLKEKHLEEILRVIDQVNLANFSDHLCMTEAGGVEIGQLTPLPFTEKSVSVVCKNLEGLQKKISSPILFENIANRFLIPGGEYSESEFINAIANRTGCQVLLDLHNLYANSVNFGYNPFEWLESLNLDSVGGIHLAGGEYDDEGTLVDSHSNHVPDPVWDLYRYVCERTSLSFSIVEWTENSPRTLSILQDTHKAKQILRSSEQGIFSKSKRLGVSI